MSEVSNKYGFDLTTRFPTNKNLDAVDNALIDVIETITEVFRNTPKGYEFPLSLGLFRTTLILMSLVNDDELAYLINVYRPSLFDYIANTKTL